MQLTTLRVAADRDRRWDDMITHLEFASMRLSEFVDDVSALECWQFMERQWVGEAVGFTEWRRPLDAPERLGSVSIAMSDLPHEVVASMLARMQLDLSPGMTLDELRGRLGEPCGEQSFVADRHSYDFRVGDIDHYDISCTVHHDDGLIYLVVMTAAA